MLAAAQYLQLCYAFKKKTPIWKQDFTQITTEDFSTNKTSYKK